MSSWLEFFWFSLFCIVILFWYIDLSFTKQIYPNWRHCLGVCLAALEDRGRREEADVQTETHTHTQIHTHFSLDLWPKISNRIFKVRALWWDFALWLVGRERLGCGKSVMLSSHHLTLWKIWQPFPYEMKRQVVRIRSQVWPLKFLGKATGRRRLVVF